jgi:hypothetical protein
MATAEEALCRANEAVYLPVYDLAFPTKGPVAVLEVLLSALAPRAMAVADTITASGKLLGALGLALANPVPAPVRGGSMCGRRTRPDSDDEGERPAAQLGPPGESAAVAAAAGAAAQPSARCGAPELGPEQPGPGGHAAPRAAGCDAAPPCGEPSFAADVSPGPVGTSGHGAASTGAEACAATAPGPAAQTAGGAALPAAPGATAGGDVPVGGCQAKRKVRRMEEPAMCRSRSVAVLRKDTAAGTDEDAGSQEE